MLTTPISCPLCNAEVRGTYHAKKNTTPARVYWYCSNCHLAMTRTLSQKHDKITKQKYAGSAGKPAQPTPSLGRIRSSEGSVQEVWAGGGY